MLAPIERNQEFLVLVIDTDTAIEMLALAPTFWGWRATRHMTTTALAVPAILELFVI